MNRLSVPQVMFCPNCHLLHVACTILPCLPGDAWDWFTCRGDRFSFPPLDERERLGSKTYVRLKPLVRDTLQCPGCGEQAWGTNNNGLIEYVCYRCGDVSCYYREAAVSDRVREPEDQQQLREQRVERPAPRRRGVPVALPVLQAQTGPISDPGPWTQWPNMGVSR